MPTHVVEQPGDKYTLCGAKEPDDLPRVWIEAAQRHVDGHGMQVCPECAMRSGGRLTGHVPVTQLGLFGGGV
jgi:hypothetical protein